MLTREFAEWGGPFGRAGARGEAPGAPGERAPSDVLAVSDERAVSRG
jgi:hypothetical protein